MGLPMWKTDDEILAEETAAKLERAAAQSRSSIRREHTTRPGRDQPSSISLSNAMRNRQQYMLRTRERLQREQTEADSHIAALEAELEQYRRHRPSSLRPHRGLGPFRAGHDEARSRDASSLDVMLVSDENDPGLAFHAHSVTLPRPSRESNLRFEMAASSSTRPTSPLRPSTYMPSPPRSAGEENRDRSIPDGPLEPWESTPPLSDDFAPARAAREALGQSSGLADSPLDSLRAMSGMDRQGLTPPPESWQDSYPALRRVRHMSPRPLPRVDGLGDRHRSPSPSSDAHEEETWSNLLSTMASGLSSATTSFASTADSVSRSGRSSQNTSTSFGEIGSADDTCDLDLPPGITEEDVREVRARHRRNNRQSYREMNESVARRMEVGMFQQILDRMQRREDVPDDWWAIVGLPPDFGRANFSTP